MKSFKIVLSSERIVLLVKTAFQLQRKIQNVTEDSSTFVPNVKLFVLYFEFADCRNAFASASREFTKNFFSSTQRDTSGHKFKSKKLNVYIENRRDRDEKKKKAMALLSIFE